MLRFPDRLPIKNEGEGEGDMKDVLMFVDTEQYAKDLAAMTDEERAQAVRQVEQWFADHAGKVHMGSKLQPAHTATTVRLQGGAEPVITDGPDLPHPDPAGPEQVEVTAREHAEDMERVVRERVERVVREHAGRLAASLVSLLGDFSAAEDLVQDAVETALVRWPADGVPERPEAWLYTVARRRGLDLLRRESTYRDKLALLRLPEPGEPDDRLRLIFTCCHPALSRQAQVALTLRVVCGLTAAEIAAAFLTQESTVAQRITRAKKKIAEAGIPYRVPSGEELSGRLREVLTVIYLLFNEGYLSSTLDRAQARDLVDDAEWLASLLAGLMPDEPETAGLLALIRLHRARGAASTGPSRCATSTAPRRRWPSSRTSAKPLTATRSTTPPAPSCSATWAAGRGPDRPTNALSP
jgi:RNA polymerase sigma factor (sigma-70 family)